MKLHNRKDSLEHLKAKIVAELQTRAKFNWGSQARPAQLPPTGDWKIWLIMAGRGFGKTRTGAETIRMWAESNQYHHIALVADSEHDGRSVMIEGPSGLLAIHPPRQTPVYEPSKRKLTWANGTVATLYSSESYEQLRGPQFDAAWIDELAKFRNANAVWDQLMFGLRLGPKPRVIITTTPRPLPLLSQLLKREDVVVTSGSTFDNQANLAPDFLRELEQRYHGTPLGDQEIYARLIDINNQQLWNLCDLSSCRGAHPPALLRTIISIDPAVSSHTHSDETGIIVAGADAQGVAYVLNDLSGRYSPQEWAQTVITAYHHYRAGLIIAETNQGGEMVHHVLNSYQRGCSFKAVRAAASKYWRAQPVAALYKQNRVKHVGSFPELEAQMLNCGGNTNADRLDAMVWAIHELLLDNRTTLPHIWRV